MLLREPHSKQPFSWILRLTHESRCLSNVHMAQECEAAGTCATAHTHSWLSASVRSCMIDSQFRTSLAKLPRLQTLKIWFC